MAGARRGQRCAQRGVAGVLHPDRVARLQQHPQHQVDRLLRAGRHHHLVGVAAHRAGGAEVGGDRLAQRPRALRVAIAEQRRVGACRRRRRVRLRQTDWERSSQPVRPVLKGRVEGCGEAGSGRKRSVEAGTAAGAAGGGAGAASSPSGSSAETWVPAPTRPVTKPSASNWS